MQCPHCTVEIHGNPSTLPLGKDPDGIWVAVTHTCPACTRLILEVICTDLITGSGPGLHVNHVKKRFYGYPKPAPRNAPPPEVPSLFAVDYVEAAAVLSLSPKASAALSRRCLQHLLREKAGVKKADLAREIDEVIASRALPAHLSEAIDAVRNIGNFAAHPVKSTASGEIVNVEPGEAEWTLDVLDGLFDFYFVQPALLQARRTALNSKLAAAGKPPIK